MAGNNQLTGLSGLLKLFIAPDLPDTPQNNLYKAARTGDVTLLKETLTHEDVDINKLDINDRTALYFATEKNCKDSVDMLLQNGAETNICNPLYIVNDVEIAKKLVDAGADVNFSDEYGSTPLHRAVLRENLSLIQFYTKLKAKLNVADFNGLTPLHLACRWTSDWNLFEIVQSLITSGSKVNSKDNNGKNALHYACENTDTGKIIEILVENGAVQGETDFAGLCPIHYLIRQFKRIDTEGLVKYFQAMDILLKNKENVNLCETNGQTILHTAAAEGSEAVVKYLLSHGCQPDQTDGCGRIPLHHVAMRNENSDVADLLIKAGCCINIKDRWGQSPLFAAVEYENMAFAKLLLENGADLNSVDSKGRSVSHAAAGNRSCDVMNFLLSSGASFQIVDEDLSSVLHLACWNDSMTVTELLLQKGADINAEDKNGLTPVHVACFKRSEKAISILNEQKGKTCDPTARKEIEGIQIETFSNYADDFLELCKLQELLNTENSICRSEKDLEHFLKKILKTPSIGHVGSDEEAREIQNAVEEMVRNVVAKIPEVDSRFRCTLLHAGSSSEGTKVRLPDEFDFMLCLEEFSKHCYAEFPEEDRRRVLNCTTDKSGKSLGERLQDQPVLETVTSISDYALMYLKDDEDSEPFMDFSYMKSRLLPCHVMFHIFSQLLTKIIFAPDFPRDPRLVVKEVTIDPAVKMCWRGCRYKDMGIDIDIVPAIKLKDWPEKVSQSMTLITSDITQLPAVVVPKMTSGQDEDFWRCSMSLRETAIFRKLHPRIRNSYIICKALIHNSTCPLVSFDDYDEEILMYKMENSIGSDEDPKAYDSADKLVPSYIVKMAFLEAVEQRAIKEGIESVYVTQTGKEGCQAEMSKGNPSSQIQTNLIESRSYGPARSMNIPSSSDDFDASLVTEVFTRLENGLEKSFIPSFFNKEHNVLGSRLLEEGCFKVLYFVSYILKLLR